MDGFVIVVMVVRCCWRGVGCCAAVVIGVGVVVEGGVLVLLFEVGEGRELMSGGDIITYLSTIFKVRYRGLEDDSSCCLYSPVVRGLDLSGTLVDSCLGSLRAVADHTHSVRAAFR